MTKKVKISFMILVWSIVAIQIYVNYQEKMKNRSELVTAFSVSENEVADETVNGYGYFGAMELSEETKERMLRNLAQKLGITDGYTFMNGNGSGFEKKMLVKHGQFAETTLQIISLRKDVEETEQYVVLEIKAKEDISKAITLYQKVKRIYKEIGMEGQISLEVSMEKDGLPEEPLFSELADEIFDLTEAVKVDEVRENDIFTIYGYTRLEDSFLKLKGKKVNIQVVLSYDKENQRMHCKMGIPIVNSSY